MSVEAERGGGHTGACATTGRFKRYIANHKSASVKFGCSGTAITTLLDAKVVVEHHLKGHYVVLE